MNEYVILRRFPGPNGIMFERGQIVSDQGFRARNLQSLVERHYMGLVEGTGKAEPAGGPPSTGEGEVAPTGQPGPVLAASPAVPVAASSPAPKRRGRPPLSRNKPKVSGAVIEA